MYALFEIQGKQYKAEKEASLVVDRLEKEPGDSLEFPVLFFNDGKNKHLGQPYVEGVKVQCMVKEHTKGPKVLVGKHNRTYRKLQGHRQPYTVLQVKKIV